jgi:hypothetical protein
VSVASRLSDVQRGEDPPTVCPLTRHASFTAVPDALIINMFDPTDS